MRHSYPDSEPAWVEDPGKPGRWALRWLNRLGQPVEEIGVQRELDVPGIHTHAAAARILSMPLVKQVARMWASSPEGS